MVAITEFVAVTREYLAAVDGLGSRTRCEFLAACARLLPRLYQLGQDLPEVELESTISDLPEIENRMFSIGGLLGDADIYAEVFDPVHDRELLTTHLSDDLADIYRDLAGPLALYETGDHSAQAEALWHWRFNITGHCGEHIVDALRPIHRLLYDHLCPER